jgi:hypothetical protein
MKAYLVTSEGFVREYEVCPPFPEVITMAQASPAQILDPKDLMTGEMGLKTIKFRLKHKLPTENAAVYEEFGNEAIQTMKKYTMDDIYSALKPKLVEKIEEAMSSTSPIYDHYYGQKKKASAAELQYMQNMQTQYNPQLQPQAAYATNVTYYQQSPFVPAAWDDSTSPTLTPPASEPEPKAEVPDPIEPKKRLMKK